MLAAGGLLEALSQTDNKDDYKNCNDDHDFSEVLMLFGDDVNKNREIRCSDGQKRNFSFVESGDEKKK